MKKFNTTGSCDPEEHYMVDLQERLAQIKNMITDGKYFTINRGRQYGKTTILHALTDYLSKEYIVVTMDFQLLDYEDFQSVGAFVKAFSRELWKIKSYRICMSEEVQREIKAMKKAEKKYSLSDLFSVLSEWCDESEKPIVLMIDEVDQASNYQIFLDFLAQLRYYYLNRKKLSAFQSVILAGVHDIRNLKRKIRTDDEHQHNSPWNIAAAFNVKMNFSQKEIAGMLEQYEADQHTGMNIQEISTLIDDETSGYPVLVSAFCQLIDETICGTEGFPTKSSAWTKEGVLKAGKILLTEKTPLFDSLIDKLKGNEKLRTLLELILFNGRNISYNADNDAIDLAAMYGFVTNRNGQLAVFNRIFETRIYDWLLSEDMTNIEKFSKGNQNQFIHQGKLNMERVLEKFVEDFDLIYGGQNDQFKEEAGRRLFLLYLKPIINGTGYYYIEAQTRDDRRMDLVVSYGKEQHIIELKIWHGDKYHAEAEKQISDYLDNYHLKKGYLLTFSFNKKKEIGIRHVQYQDKELIEAIV